jgi:simple sugar transport system substrate-binding protein
MKRSFWAAAAVAASFVAGSWTTAPAFADSAQAKLKIVYISHDPLTDPWMIPVAAGLDQAAKDLNVDVIFRSVQNLTGAANDEVRLITDAAGLKPDGIIVANWNPTALNPAIKKVVDSGTPVVITVAGFGQTAASGALTYVGNDENQLGYVGGEQLKKLGATNALVMTSLPGLEVADQRAAGFSKGFAPGNVTDLQVPVDVLLNTTGLVNATLAALQKDPKIDSVFSIGACCSAAFVAVINRLGDRAKTMHFGTVDLGLPVLQAIKNGKVDFALDGQQYLQGYDSVETLANYVRYDFQPANSVETTGPVIVDKSNVDRITTLAKANLR